MVPADLGHRGGQHDEELVGLCAGIELGADFGQREHSISLMTLQTVVQLPLDGRADQQRKLRVVDAQMDAQPFRRSKPVQRQSGLEQGFDVGHAHQTEADALAAGRVDAMVLLVQFDGSLAHQGCKVLRGLCPVLGWLGWARQRHQHATAAGLGGGKLGKRRTAVAGEGRVRSFKDVGLVAFDLGLPKFVQPGAADRRRCLGSAGLFPPVALEVLTPIAVGLEQALHQRGRQRRRRQQHPRAEQAGPVHQSGQRGQIGQVEVVGFVQHQVAAEQAQHRGDLAAAALAFSRGGQVVNGADQQRGADQRAHLRVGNSPS